MVTVCLSHKSQDYYRDEVDQATLSSGDVPGYRTVITVCLSQKSQDCYRDEVDPATLSSGDVPGYRTVVSVTEITRLLQR